MAQLLTSMDSIHLRNTQNEGAVMVLGATNRPDTMDMALRCAGRFNREIVLEALDKGSREEILQAMMHGMRAANNLNYRLLTKKMLGFVGANVWSLLKDAAVITINRIFWTGLLGSNIGGGGSTASCAVAGTHDGSRMKECWRTQKLVVHPRKKATMAMDSVQR